MSRLKRGRVGLRAEVAQRMLWRADEWWRRHESGDAGQVSDEDRAEVDALRVELLAGWGLLEPAEVAYLEGLAAGRVTDERTDAGHAGRLLRRFRQVEAREPVDGQAT